jgi:hypothetical protein
MNSDIKYNIEKFIEDVYHIDKSRINEITVRYHYYVVYHDRITYGIFKEKLISPEELYYHIISKKIHKIRSKYEII